MKILQTIKAKSKYLFGAILSIALLAQVVSFAGNVEAVNPQFNFMQGDNDLLRGANRTSNQADWSDPVSGNAGDTFAGIVYYHNGRVDTTARNVRIKVSIPAQTSDKVAKLSASISADNASTVTETVIDGTLKGNSGLTVNLNEEANLALVPGSVKWFPNFNSVSTPNQPIPFGQSGNEILSGNGLNIGDIQGCWQYMGYVTFLFKTERIALPTLNIDKTVRNVTIGETSFVDQNQAKPGDVLEYKVTVNNGGAGVADNLIITDTIPAGTQYIAGTTSVTKNGAPMTGLPDSLTGDGIALGKFETGNSAEIRFRVRVNQNVTNGQTLINTAFLHFSKEVLTDTATTTVKFGIVTPPKEGELPKTGGNQLILSGLFTIFAGLGYTYWKYSTALKALIARS